MNKIVIIGNLTKDPEVRSTTSGISVCSFTVAVNKRRKQNQTEEPPPMFYRVTTWRQLAELCGKFLKKGSKVYVDGDLSVSTYQGNDGQNRFSLEVESQNIEFLSGMKEREAEPEQQKPQEQQFTQVQIPEDELPF